MAEYEVQITKGALGDSDAIRSFIAVQRGEDSAEEWMSGFEEVIRLLERYRSVAAVRVRAFVPKGPQHALIAKASNGGNGTSNRLARRLTFGETWC